LVVKKKHLYNLINGLWRIKINKFPTIFEGYENQICPPNIFNPALKCAKFQNLHHYKLLNHCEPLNHICYIKFKALKQLFFAF
jgi:hypothetical protein